MKTSKFFLTTLFAAATMAFNASALAETVNLEEGEIQPATTDGNTYVASSTGPNGQWIGQASVNQASFNLGNMTLEGTSAGNGIVGFFIRNGNGNAGTLTINLQGVDATNYNGRITALNAWNNSTNVQITGTKLSTVEYVFGSVSRSAGNSEWQRKIGIGNGPGRAKSTVTLMGATTLAGVTGTAKGAQTVDGGNTFNWNSLEVLTANTTGTTLTLAGAGTYSYFGAIGSDAVKIDLNKTGTGTQNFGGVNNFGAVSVSAGVLGLLGEVKASSITMTDGVIRVAASTMFDLKNMVAQDGVYTVITIDGGSVMGGDLLQASNFKNGDIIFGGRSAVSITGNAVTFSAVAVANLTWNGNEGSNIWNTRTDNKNWTNTATSEADSFYVLDNVTFGVDGVKTVEVDSNGVTVGTVTVSGEGYTFTDGAISAGSIAIDGSATFFSPLAVNGAISGAGTLTKSSTGTLTLANLTGFTGTLNATAGTINLRTGLAGYTPNGYTLGSFEGATLQMGLTDDLENAVVLGDGFKGVLHITAGKFDIDKFNIGTGSYIFSGGVDFRQNSGKDGFANNVEFTGGEVNFRVNNTAGYTLSGNVTGDGTLKKSNGGHLILTGGLDLANVYMNGGTLTFLSASGKITGDLPGSSGLRQQGGTINVGNGTDDVSLTVVNYAGASDGGTAGTFNIKERAVMTVTGTKNNAGKGFAHSFQIAHWGATQTFNVGGVLNLSNVSLSVKDGTGIVNVKSTGELNLNTGLDILRDRVTVKLDGGALNIGAGGITAAGTLTLTSGTIGSLADSWSSSRAMTLGGAITVDTTKKNYTEGAAAATTANGSSITLSGVLSGAGSLTKAGVGTLTLSGGNTHTGGTTVSAGTLVLGNASALGSGSFTLDGGTVRVDTATAGVGAITLNAGTIQVTSSDVLSTTTALITSTGAISATGVIDVNVLVTMTAGTRYVILEGANLAALTPANFNFTVVEGSRPATSLFEVEGNKLFLTVGESAAANLLWNGNEGSNIWDTSMDNKNWTNPDLTPSTADSFYVLDNVTFGEAGAKAVVVDLNGVNAGAMIVSGDGYTFSGGTITARSLSGAGSLTLSNTGVSSFGDLTGFTGILNATEGTINVGAGLAGYAPGYTLGSFAGAVLQFGLTNDYANAVNTGSDFAGIANITAGNFTINTSNVGTGMYKLAGGVNMQVTETSTISNNIVLDGTTQLHTNGSNVLTVAGNVSGAGSLDKQAGGTLNLNGEVSLGVFKNSAGTTNFGANATIGTFDHAVGTVSFNASATLGSYQGGTGASTMSIVAGAVVGVTNDFTLRYEFNGTSTLNLNGTLNVGGSFNIARDGNGIVNIEDGGVLSVKKLGFGNNWNGEKSSIVNLKSGGTLIVGADGVGTSYGNINTASLNLRGGTFGTSADSMMVTNVIPVVLSNATTINTGKYAAGVFSDTGSHISLSGVLSGEGSISKVGTGILTLSGANTYTGGTTISAGTLVAANASALGTGILNLDGGTLRADVALTGIGAITLNSGSLEIIAAGLLSTTTALITSTGSVSTGTGTISVNITEPLVDGSSYIILTGTDLAGVNVDRFVLAGTAAGSFVIENGNLIMVAGGIPADLVWAGTAGNAVWNTDVETNTVWKEKEGGAAVPFHRSDKVTFDGTAANNMVTLGSDVAPRTITVSGTTPITINGGDFAIIGTGSVSIGAGATLILNGANSYTGATTIGDNATLQLGITAENKAYSSSAIGGTGTLAFNVADGVSAKISTAHTKNFANTLNLRKIGTGTLDLEGRSAAGLVVSAGTAILASDTIRDVNIEAAGTLAYRNGGTLNRNFTGTGTLAFVGDATLAYSGTFGGKLKNMGDGTLLLETALGGATSVSAVSGTVRVAHVDALKAAALSIEDATIGIDVVANGIGNITLNNATLSVMASTLSSTKALLNSTGMLTLAGTQTIHIGSFASEGTYRLISATNISGFDPTKFTLTFGRTYTTAPQAIFRVSGNILEMVLTGGELSKNLLWINTVASAVAGYTDYSEWTMETLFKSGTTDITYTDNSVITLQNGSGNGKILLKQDVTLAQLVVDSGKFEIATDSAAKFMNENGAILVKDGATLTLGVANQMKGYGEYPKPTITIPPTADELAALEAYLAKCNGIVVENNATLIVTAEGALSGGYGENAYNGDANIKIDGDLYLGARDGSATAAIRFGSGEIRGTGTVHVGVAADSEFALSSLIGFRATSTSDAITDGKIVGGISFEKFGAGTLVIDKSYDFTGTATISEGTVKLAEGVGNNPSKGAFKVETGATLDVNGVASFTTGQIILNGGRLVNTGAAVGAGVQNANVVLAADSTVGGTGNFSILSTASSLDLGGHVLVKEDTNTLTLAYTAVSAGTIDVKAGTLKFSGAVFGEGFSDVNSSLIVKAASGATLHNDSSSLVGSLALVEGATLNLERGDLKVGYLNADDTLAGAITGAGSLVKTGTGTLAVSGTASLTGTYTVSAGTLDMTVAKRAGDAGGSGQLNISGGRAKIANLGWGKDTNFGSNFNSDRINISNGGILEITTAGANARGLTVSAGTGTVQLSAAGGIYEFKEEDQKYQLVISNGATLAFDVTAADSEILVSKGIAAGSSGNPNSGSTAVSTGSIVKTGAGKLTLGNQNYYSGGTTISAGTLVVKNANALGSGTVAIEAAGTLDFDFADPATVANAINNSGDFAYAHTTNLTLTGALTNAGTFSNAGAGTLALSGNISGTGTIGASAGTLALRAATGATMTVNNNISIEEGANVTADGAGTLVYSGEISGAGAFRKIGAGTLDLAGATLANAGGVILDAGTVRNLTLNGTGNITLNAGTLEAFTLNAAAAGAINSGSAAISLAGATVLTTGKVTLTNTVTDRAYFNVSSGGTVSLGAGIIFDFSAGDVGTYQLFAGMDSIAGWDTFGKTNIRFGGNELSERYSVSKGAVGTITISSPMYSLLWKAADGLGGSGTWSLSGPTWNFLDGTSYDGAFASGDEVTFKTTADITLDGVLRPSKVTVQDGASVKFLGSDTGKLSGAGTLTLSGTGTSLALNSAHDFTGDTTLGAGTTLTLDASSVTGRMFNSTIGGAGTLVVSMTEAKVLNELLKEDNALTGDINVQKLGAGTLTINKAQTFTGGISVDVGTLVATVSEALGTGTATLNGGTLELTAAAGTTNTVANIIAGTTGGVTISGEGEVVLSGANSHSAATTVSGTAVAKNVAAFGTSAVSVSAGGKVKLNFDGDFSNVISGEGAVEIIGIGGYVDLSGANSYSGGTTISSGVVNVVNDAAFGTGTVTIGEDGAVNVSGENRALANDFAGEGYIQIADSQLTLSGSLNDFTGLVVVVDTATLILDGADDTTFGGRIQNSGAVVKRGATTLTLSGDNSAFYGSMTIEAGKIIATNGDALGIGAVRNAAALAYNISSGTAYAQNSAFTGTGTFEKLGDGELVVLGTFGHSGATTISAGTLTLNSAADQMLSTVISGAGTLVKDGAGRLELADGTNSGHYVLKAGTLAKASLDRADQTLTVESGILEDLTVSAGTVSVKAGANAKLTGSILLSGGTFVAGDVSLQPMFTLSGATTGVTVTEDVIFDLSGVVLPAKTTEKSDSYTIFAIEDGATVYDWNLLGKSNIRLNGNALSHRAEVYFGTDANAGKIWFENETYDLVWNYTGTDGVWNTTDKTWRTNSPEHPDTNPTYMDSDNVAFDKTTSVTLGAIVNPAKIDIVGTTTSVALLGDGTNRITGNSVLNIKDSAHLTLNSAHDFTGATTLGSAAELELLLAAKDRPQFASSIHGAGSSAGTLIVAVDATAAADGAVFNDVVTGAISGKVRLRKNGTGALVIDRANAFVGTSVLNGGTLVLKDVAAIGNSSLNSSAGTKIEIDASGEFANSIGGEAEFIKSGSSVLTLSGINSYTGITTIKDDGKLVIETSDALGNSSSVNFASKDAKLELRIDTPEVFATPLSSSEEGYGVLIVNNPIADSVTEITGDNHGFSGSVEINSNTLVTDPNALGTGTVTIDGGKTLTYNLATVGDSGEVGNTFSGDGSIVKTGSGTLTLSKAGTFTGGLTILNGTVVATNAAAFGTGTIDNSGALEFDLAADGTAHNAIVGNGLFNKRGIGMLTLTSKDSTYTGKTNIVAGTLSVTTAKALGRTQSVNIEAGATLEFKLSESETFDKSISGDGAVVLTCGTLPVVPAPRGLTPTSESELTLSGANDFTGGMTVLNAGLRTVNLSSIGSGDVNLNASSWNAVGGIEFIRNRKITLQNNSTLTSGDFSAASGAGVLTLDSVGVEISAGATSLLINLASDAEASVARITGTSGSQIDLTNVVVEITAPKDVRRVRLTDENVTVIGQDESGTVIFNGVVSQMFFRAGAFTLDPIMREMNLAYSSLVVMPTEMFNQDVENLRSRLDQRRYETAQNTEWQFFAQARSTSVSTGNDRADSATFDYSTYGALVGADARCGENSILGVAVGYDHGSADIHGGEGSIDMDDYRLTLYGSTTLQERFFVDAGAQVGVGSYDIDRRGQYGNNKGDADGWNAGLFATAGALFTVSQEYGIYATPYVGFTYMHSSVDAIDENGTASTHADAFSADSLRSRIGVNTSWLFDLGGASSRFALDVAYSHEFLDDELDVDMNATGIAGTTTLTEKAFAEDMISIGASLDVGLSKETSLFFGYSADIGFNSDVSHSVNAGVRFTF